MLVDELMARREMTVAEMVEQLERCGFRLSGRASKLISDALRWEVLRRRVVRVARGVYRYAEAPPTTARRIRVFAARCRAWALAVLLGEEPPSTPPNRRPSPFSLCSVPAGQPPWGDMCWLWTR